MAKKKRRKEDTINISTTVTFRKLIQFARELKSVHGENPEYDRALCELIAEATDLPVHLCKYRLAKMIGIKRAKKKMDKNTGRELKITACLETGVSYIRIKKGRTKETLDIDGVVHLDVDKNGDVLGIEILQ